MIEQKRMANHDMNMIEKASYYASKEIVVHISCEGKFYNGMIVDVNDFRIILLDKKLGEIYLPLREVSDLEPYTEPDIGENKKRELGDDKSNL